MVTSPLSLMLTTWFLQMDWVSLEFGSVTRGRMPLHAARTSPRRTGDSTEPHQQAGDAGRTVPAYLQRRDSGSCGLP